MGIFNTKREDSESKLKKASKLAKDRKRNKREAKDNYVREAMSEEIKKKLQTMDDNDNADGIKLDKELNNAKEKIATESLKKSLLTLHNRLVTEGYEKIMENILFEFVYESFWLDDEIKTKVMESLSDEFSEVIKLLESNGIKPVDDRHATQLIKNIREVAMETAKKVADRITKEANEDCYSKEDVDEIGFYMNDQELDELDNNLSDLGKDDIEELVKTKVLTVIADEQQAGERKAEILQELDNEINGAETTDESEEVTDDTTEEPSDNTATKESFDLLINRRKRAKLIRNTGSSLFESIMMYSNKSVKDTVLTEGISGMTDNTQMDTIFINAVFTYTVLETLNTLQVYNLNPTVVKGLTEKFKMLAK